MVYKPAKITQETDELLEKCIENFLRHNPQFREMKISRNKIIYELANYYLKI